MKHTWDFRQEVYCDISDFTRLCGLIWAAKLGVSTVIQWQDRSIGCITGKKIHCMEKHFTWDPTYRDTYKGKQRESSIDKSPLKEDGQISCMHCKKLETV